MSHKSNKLPLIGKLTTSMNNLENWQCALNAAGSEYIKILPHFPIHVKFSKTFCHYPSLLDLHYYNRKPLTLNCYNHVLFLEREGVQAPKKIA